MANDTQHKFKKSKFYHDDGTLVVKGKSVMENGDIIVAVNNDGVNPTAARMYVKNPYGTPYGTDSNEPLQIGADVEKLNVTKKATVGETVSISTSSTSGTTTTTTTLLVGGDNPSNRPEIVLKKDTNGTQTFPFIVSKDGNVKGQKVVAEKVLEVKNVGGDAQGALAIEGQLVNDHDLRSTLYTGRIVVDGPDGMQDVQDYGYNSIEVHHVNKQVFTEICGGGSYINSYMNMYGMREDPDHGNSSWFTMYKCVKGTTANVNTVFINTDGQARFGRPDSNPIDIYQPVPVKKGYGSPSADDTSSNGINIHHISQGVDGIVLCGGGGSIWPQIRIFNGETGNNRKEMISLNGCAGEIRTRGSVISSGYTIAGSMSGNKWTSNEGIARTGLYLLRAFKGNNCGSVVMDIPHTGEDFYYYAPFVGMVNPYLMGDPGTIDIEFSSGVSNVSLTYLGFDHYINRTD